MDASSFLALAMTCAPQVDAATTYALVAVESGFNPHAIGVVGGALLRQPRTRAEALATASQLRAQGWNFSLGLAQINVGNLDRLGLDTASALEPCENLRAMQSVLMACFDRFAVQAAPQTALRQALSCYYSGNGVTGFRHGYVRRVAQAAQTGRRPSGVPP